MFFSVRRCLTLSLQIIIAESSLFCPRISMPTSAAGGIYVSLMVPKGVRLSVCQGPERTPKLLDEMTDNPELALHPRHLNHEEWLGLDHPRGTLAALKVSQFHIIEPCRIWGALNG
jgi:hypothetical protein